MVYKVQQLKTEEVMLRVIAASRPD